MECPTCRKFGKILYQYDEMTQCEEPILPLITISARDPAVETCPTCSGTGYVDDPRSITEIFSAIDLAARKGEYNGTLGSN